MQSFRVQARSKGFPSRPTLLGSIGIGSSECFDAFPGATLGRSRPTDKEVCGRPPMTDHGPPKKLRCIQRSVDRHWVGDGFPVRTLFAYPNLGPVIDPFLLLDYAGPVEFPPTGERRGVGEHPHRGF